MPLDYETLRVIWWLLLGVLLIGFAVMDGFDLGVAIWLPFLSKTDDERRILINSIAPTWEGNQVWFVLGGGAIFAAWPMLYALSFSGFYIAMLLVLLALILRPLGFKYRSKLENKTWRSIWDYSLFISGFVPTLIFGVAIGNVLQGVPFYIDDNLRAFYLGTFWALLNPFALLCGVISLCMLAAHGAYMLNIKTEGYLQIRAKKAAAVTSVLLFILFIVAGLWLYTAIDGYSLTSEMAHNGPSNPLYKSVARKAHAWFFNYEAYPLSMAAPSLALGSILIALLSLRKFEKIPFFFSALAVAGIIATVGVSMFPFILPSSTNPDSSLLVWDSSSSHLTLFVMLIATLIFMPLILLYTSWVYKVLGGKVNKETIQQEQAY